MRGIESVIDEYLKHMQERADAYGVVQADSQALSSRFRECVEAGDMAAAAMCGEELAVAVDHVCAVGRHHVRRELEFVRELVFYCAICKTAAAESTLREHVGIGETLDSFITEEIAYLDPEQA
jgi:hypothetical protein